MEPTSVIVFGNDEGVNPEEVTFGDVDAIAAQVPNVAAMAPVLYDIQTVSIRNKPKSLRVLGTPPAYRDVRNLVLTSGRFFSEQDETQGAKVAVISKKLARQLFGTEEVHGEALRLFNLRFPIIGVYREAVESAAAVEQSEAAGLAAIIPFSTFRKPLGCALGLHPLLAGREPRSRSPRPRLGAERHGIAPPEYRRLHHDVPRPIPRSGKQDLGRASPWACSPSRASRFWWAASES